MNIAYKSCFLAVVLNMVDSPARVMTTAETFAREVVIDEMGIDLERGTARLSFSSTLPVIREDKDAGVKYWEVLDHGPGNVNIAVLNTNGVVLMNHDENNVIGDVIRGSVRIRRDQKGAAEIRLYSEKQYLLEGIATRKMDNTVSVGYVRLSELRREKTSPDGLETRFYSWSPYEISILAGREPADPEVGFGRSKSNMKSFDDVLALALSGSRNTNPDFSELSLAELLDWQKQPRGLVREAQSIRPEKIGGDFLMGYSRFIPFEALLPVGWRGQRDLTVSGGGSVSSASAFVKPDLAPIASVLKNRTAAVELGAVVISGLEGHFALPRQTAPITTNVVAEVAGATKSNITFDQPLGTPHRVTATVTISNQMLKISPGVEAFLRAEFASQIAVAVDKLIFFGGENASEPVGIFNQPGVGSVIYGGASWTGVLAAEKALSDLNADVGNLGWAMSSATRNFWKGKSKISATNYPSFLMEGGRANDYPVSVTQNLSGTNQTVFGAWQDCLLLIWGEGIEVIKNPYDLDVQGETRFTCHLWMDVVLRHPQSFCVSVDTGAA